jgi:Cold shock proteins
MKKGKVKFFNAGKGFGIVIDDSDNSEVFIHFSQIIDDAKILLENEEVEYDVNKSEKGLNAMNLHRSFERRIGRIDSFQSGYGFIKEQTSEEKYFIHYSDIEGDGFKKIEDDFEVEFTPDFSDKGLQAKRVVVRDQRSALQKFALFSDLSTNLRDLTGLAQKEDGNWDYINEKTNEFPVLSSYLTYTFKRLQQENKIEFTSKSNGTKYACFNTGLATKKHEEIFAYFEHIDNNPSKKVFREGYLKKSSWIFDRFDKESYRIMNYFKDKPKLANYFQNPADLIYDTSKRLIPDFDHIADDREKRFPPSFAAMTKAQQVEKIKAAINTALMRIERNYKTAIPQFYDGNLQLLLPLCLDNIENADVALVAAKEGEVYRANTVLSLDWPYNNARLLARPDREWLNP